MREVGDERRGGEDGEGSVDNASKERKADWCDRESISLKNKGQDDTKLN